MLGPLVDAQITGAIRTVTVKNASHELHQCRFARFIRPVDDGHIRCQSLELKVSADAKGLHVEVGDVHQLASRNA